MINRNKEYKNNLEENIFRNGFLISSIDKVIIANNRQIYEKKL